METPLPHPESTLRRKLLGLGVCSFILIPSHGLAKQLAPLPRISARHAFAGNFDDIYYSKAADTPVPIASITKLFTAWTVLSSDQDLNESIQIRQEDVATAEYTRSSLNPGSHWRRAELLEWLLIASDNRAAAALSRTYPGGHEAFRYARQSLATQVQLLNLDFGDAAGLSPRNKASARDLAFLILTLAQHPWFQRLSQRPHIHGRSNTNRWAHDRSVQLMSGKTGFTSNAGYCLAQAEKIDNQMVALVVLHAGSKDARAQDISALRRYTAAII